MPELQQKSLRDRLAVQYLLLTSATIIVLTVVAVVIAGAHIKQRVLLQLASKTAAVEDLLEQRLRQDWENLAIWSKQPTASTQTSLQNLYDLAQQEGIPLQGIGVFTADGNKLRSVGSFTFDTLERKVGGGIPVVTDEGWVGHLVVVPMQDAAGNVPQFFVGQFDMRETLNVALNTSEIGETAELLLGAERDGNLILFHHRYVGGVRNVSIGSVQEYIAKNDPLAKAVLHQEGVSRTKNYENRDVFAAYKYLPRLGWGLALTIDASEALIGLSAIGVVIIAVGLLLLGMAMILAISFASRLTAPLQKMANFVAELGPNNWQYNATAETDDEVSLVDKQVADMAHRLEGLYDNLEKQVQDRTAELREQYEIDKAILASALHGIVLVAPNGHIKSMNPAAEKYICRDAKMCENLPAHQIFRIFRQEHAVDNNQHPVMQCLRTGEPITPQADVLWSLQRATGELMAIDITVTPVFSNNNVIGAVAMFRDVSEERHVDEVKSEFISLASHQLRTPLSVIKWYTELLEDDGSTEKDPEVSNQYLSEIRNAGDRMSNLVDALLQAAQLESKGILAEKSEVNMNAFMSDLEKELESLAKDKHISCSLELPKEKISAFTDPVLLHIVVQNLFSNAVKYTSDNGVVNITLKKSHNAVVIEVQDTGMGIPEQDAKRIFERLFRAENAKKTVTDGSGLGLYISHMIIDILGGEISFKSKEGKGTTFTVQLPMKE